MSGFKSDFLRTLFERGFIHQISDAVGIDILFSKETVSGYIGFDPTAPSLHVGSLIPIMILYWMQKTGHRPIALMGGGTGMVGDPSFKDEARKLMTEETIKTNIEGIRNVFGNYLTFGEGQTDAIIIDNASWLCDLNYLEFLREVGRHFSVNRMLSFDSVKQRLEREQSLSFLEFNYMILQAYDFVELHQRFGVKLQMGGSDQWGNIVNGIDLGHKMLNTQLYALTSPLLTTTSGAKMGKSLSGAIWLNANLLSPYDFWQYWRNTDDTDLERFLKLYTTLPLDEIARLSVLKGAEINDTKKILATEVTALLHGRKIADRIAETARQVFEEGVLSENLPSVEIPRDRLQAGIGIQMLLVTVGFAKSNSQARRHIQGDAVRVNDENIRDECAIITTTHLTADGVMKLSVGKKKHILIRPS